MILELTTKGLYLDHKLIGPTGKAEQLDYYQGGCLAIDGLRDGDKATYEVYNRIIAGHPKENNHVFRTGLLETVNALIEGNDYLSNNKYRLITAKPELNDIINPSLYETGRMGLYYKKQLLIETKRVDEIREVSKRLLGNYNRVEIAVPYEVGGLSEKEANKLLYHVVDVYRKYQPYYDYFTLGVPQQEPLEEPISVEPTTGLVFV